ATLGIVIAAREKGLGRAVALFGQPPGLGQSRCKRPRSAFRHGHPPRHRFRVSECDDAVHVVPRSLVVALLELEAEVLPAPNLADLGKWHPQSLLGRAAAECIGKQRVIAGQGAAKTVAGLEPEAAETNPGPPLLRHEPQVVSQIKLARTLAVADAE